MQGNLPLNVGLLYECMNPDCFYDGTLLRMDDVVWKHYWDSRAEDLLVRSVCPSCHEPMAIWDEGD